MSKKKQAKKTGKPGRPPQSRYVHFRFPQPLIERLDRFAKDETERTGYFVNRSAALRKLVELGLEAREASHEAAYEAPALNPTETPRGRPGKVRVRPKRQIDLEDQDREESDADE